MEFHDYDIHGFRDHSGMPATFQALLSFIQTCKNSNWGEEGLLDCLKIPQASLWETVNSSKDTIEVPPCHCSNCTSKPVQIKHRQTSMHFQG
jgi:hypothetical protein